MISSASSRSRRVPGPFRRGWLLVAGCLMVFLIRVLFWWSDDSEESLTVAPSISYGTNRSAAAQAALLSLKRPGSGSKPAQTAEQIVMSRLVQFGKSRRNLAHLLAQRRGMNLPDEVSRFFDAVESGKWEEISARFQEINGGDSSASHEIKRTEEVSAVWPAWRMCWSGPAEATKPASCS